MLVHVALSGDDCHWKVKALAAEKPVSSRMNGTPGQASVTEEIERPPVGVPEQAGNATR
jgi:hypothetical protein